MVAERMLPQTLPAGLPARGGQVRRRWAGWIACLFATRRQARFLNLTDYWNRFRTEKLPDKAAAYV